MEVMNIMTVCMSCHGFMFHFSNDVSSENVNSSLRAGGDFAHSVQLSP